jgi:hypothetical protein
MTRSCTAAISLVSALFLITTSAQAQSPVSSSHLASSERELALSKAMTQLHVESGYQRAGDTASVQSSSPHVVMFVSSGGHPRRWIGYGALVGAVVGGVAAASSAGSADDEVSSVAVGPAFAIGAVMGAVAGGIIGGLSYLVSQSSSHASSSHASATTPN